MRRFDKKHNIEKANLLAEQRYLESKGLIKENITTLGDILQKKGNLDHLKNNQIRLKLIDGEFLKKNPEWKDKSLRFLFYDNRSNMVGVELIGADKSGNAYPKELVIDLEQTNIK
tara:strand:- start:946 stop:1290 length:345 start_codon:yes stop_codon:yes gene_type:complete